MSEKRAEQVLRRAKRKVKQAQKARAAPERVPSVRGKFTGTGNRCGHRKDAPLPYVPPPEHKPRPHPLVDLEKQGELIYKLLRKVRRESSPGRPSGRRTRSEARDAAQVACCCGLHYLNRKTMTIEIPAENGSGDVGVGYALIAERTGINYWRVQRAFAVLYEIGWVVAERVAKRLPNGQLAWLPSIRRFTRAFFVALRKGPWYDGWTGRTRKKEQKQARAAEARAKAQEEAPTDPLVVLFKRVLQRVGKVAATIQMELWRLIAYRHKTDEDELVSFVAARAPP